jgi:uncharacterized protein DUF732
MSLPKLGVRLIGAALAAGALLGATTATASAWPIPLTSEDNNYLGAVRGAWPVDDDTLLMAGKWACHQLYSGAGTQGAIDGTAAQYGATPEQAAAVVRAARGTYCTQAPS